MIGGIVGTERVVGDCTQRAVQRFIGLSRPRPDRASKRHKGGNTEVDIASTSKISMSDTEARNWRATYLHVLKRLTNHFVPTVVSSHPHPFRFAPRRRCMVKILRKGGQLETR